MALKVQKSEKVLIVNKALKPMLEVLVRVSWQGKKGGPDVDLDLTTIALKDDPVLEFGRGIGEEHVCYFENLRTLKGAMESSGDDRDGESGEEIIIRSSLLPRSTSKVSALLTIYDAGIRGQTLANLESATLEVVDPETKDVLYVTDISSDNFDVGMQSILFAEFHLTTEGLVFEAVNKCFKKEIGDYFMAYGFTIEQ